MHRAISIAVALAIAGSVSLARSDTSYVEGVLAFQAGDYVTARARWSNAVNDGDATAMNNLGYLLAEGLGGPRDRERAVALWRRAADLGQSEAKLHLGNAYELGMGVKADTKQAYAWYRCAVTTAQAATEDVEIHADVARNAGALLLRVRENLQPDQLESAELLAKQCMPTGGQRVSPEANNQGDAQPSRSVILDRCPVQVQPEYPSEALKSGTKGLVDATVRIEHGMVKEVLSLTGPQVFHAAVVLALGRYKCVQSEPVIAHQIFSFQFEEPDAQNESVSKGK